MTITPILAAEAADNLWTALPSILWVGLIVSCLLLFRAQLASLITHLTRRIRSGAAVKVGAVELGAVRTTQQPSGGTVSSTVALPTRQAARDGIYQAARGFMLVHRLFRSDTDGQHYDILIYLIPHKGASLVEVTRVEYFLGRFWGNQIFTATDRSHGFALLASAYGPFLCTAEVFFNDGTSHTLSRYIDFEMGEYAPFLEHDDG
jgi:hypothetical protein